MDFSKIRNYLFLGLLAVVTLIFLLLLRPFAYPIFWAMVIAGLFYPLYKRLDGYFRVPSLSAILTVIVVILIIILPLTIITQLVVVESLALYEKLNTNLGHLNQLILNITTTIKNSPILIRFDINEAEVGARVAEATRWVITYIFTFAKSFTQNSVQFVIMFVIMLYTLFFFIRDGEKLLKKLMYLCPLGDKYEQILYRKFTATTQASIKGTLVVALIQGALGGIMFAIVGIPGALIWGILMVLFSLIPGLGTFIIWFPAAVIMLILGNIWQAIVIVAVGTLLIGTIDNFLRPILVGKGLHIHPLLILFSTLGGLLLFGISGFIIGPIIASLFMSFWEMYEEYYRTELKHN